MSSLRWGGQGGKQLWFSATRVSEGTVPPNSTWTMNSLPRVDATACHPNETDAFPAVCYDPHAPAEGGFGGLCSGWYGPDDLEIVDTVRVPVTLTPGPYVVQWRWECAAATRTQ